MREVFRLAGNVVAIELARNFKTFIIEIRLIRYFAEKKLVYFV